MKNLHTVARRTLIVALLGLLGAFWGLSRLDAQEATLEAVETPVAPIVVEDGGVLIQESPVDENTPTRDEVAITVLTAAVGVVVVLGLPMFLALLFMAWNHVPAWAQQLTLQNRGWIESRVDAGTDLLGTIASRTPNTLDDQIASYVNEAVDKAIRDFFDQRGTPPPEPPAQGSQSLPRR